MSKKSTKPVTLEKSELCYLIAATIFALKHDKGAGGKDHNLYLKALPGLRDKLVTMLTT